MLLETSFGLLEEAKAIRDAVVKSLEDGIVTVDIRRENPSSTTEVGAYIAKLVEKNAKVTA
jgi:3-isopropylmalate dehydrogenase